jgi:hypothetical protein
MPETLLNKQTLLFLKEFDAIDCFKHVRERKVEAHV